MVINTDTRRVEHSLTWYLLLIRSDLFPMSYLLSNF